MNSEILKVRSIFVSLIFIMLFAYNSFAQTYSISGTIIDKNGAPINDAEVHLYDYSIASTFQTTSNNNGFYTFSDLPEGGNYSIFTKKINYYFEPRDQIILNINSNQTVDFTGMELGPPYYSISGTVRDKNGAPMNDVTVVLNGYFAARSYYATPDSNGFYVFLNLSSESMYDVRVLKDNYYFAPLYRVIDTLNSNQTVNFIGTEVGSVLYTLSGTVRDKDGAPVVGLAVTLSDYPPKANNYGTIFTDTNGYYAFLDVPGGSNYMIEPAMVDNYLFDQPAKIIVTLSSDIIADFVLIPIYSITCIVKDKDGAPVRCEIQLDLDDAPYFSRNTDINGFCNFSYLMAVNKYTITPYHYNYSFNPSNITFDGLDSNKTVEFIATDVLYLGNFTELPDGYSLEQNYPNPFNPSTKIKYAIKEAGFVSIQLFDVFGREVKKLVNTYQPSGNYEITFDAANLSSGVYYYRLNINDFTAAKKMLLMK